VSPLRRLEDLLALTRPGVVMEMGTTESWRVLRRSYTRDGDLINTVSQERMTITVELVRADSPADLRRLPLDAPRPDDSEEDRHGR
jgi:hypothetical protein